MATENEVAVPTIEEAGFYVLMGEITEESVKPVIEWILHHSYVEKRKKRELILSVCSQGGDLSAAFALIDTMRSSLVPVKTVGIGQIASSGLLIFLAGEPGRRILTSNTSILSHQFAWHNSGKGHELFSTVREYELTTQRMVDHYVNTTGLSVEVIREKLLPPSDVWLSAEEALELNVCDAIDYLKR